MSLEREIKKSPVKLLLQGYFLLYMRIFDFGFLSYFRLDLDISCLVDIIITQRCVKGKG